MKKVIPIILITLLFVSCNRNSKTENSVMSEEKQTLESAYRHADSLYAKCGRIDSAAFNEFISKTLDYVDKHPDDSLSPDMLYKAGVGSMILAKSAKNPVSRAENAKKGLAIYNQFQDLYPQHESAKLCYWQRAIIYDDILGDWRSAETEYRDFINRYPDDSLTPGFIQYLKILGKSPEEIEDQLNIK